MVCPGSLAEQWQDELYRRFQLPFEIMTNDKLEAARTGNWFVETPLAIARLDKLARDEAVQDLLNAGDSAWDLVICDEAHKMSASFFGGEVQIYQSGTISGQLLSTRTRNFLLLTATPHKRQGRGFSIVPWPSWTPDRFEGRFRDGVHTADVSDLMRRMVKENPVQVRRDTPVSRAESIRCTVPVIRRRSEALQRSDGLREGWLQPGRSLAEWTVGQGRWVSH